jgi:hypothetical protein
LKEDHKDARGTCAKQLLKSETSFKLLPIDLALLGYIGKTRFSLPQRGEHTAVVQFTVGLSGWTGAPRNTWHEGLLMLRRAVLH